MATRSSARVPLPGSHKQPIEGARRIGKLDPTSVVEVTVRLRSRARQEHQRAVAAVSGASLSKRVHLTREEFAARFGASPADIRQVEAFAHDHGLTVVASHPGQRTLRLSGTTSAMEQAFGVSLGAVTAGGEMFRHRSGTISVPQELSGVIEGVFGLDNRPAVSPHFLSPLRAGRAVATRSLPHPFTPPEVAKLYAFPPKLDGAGQCIAILEFGGGYRQADLKTYFAKLGLPLPKISAVSVNGGRNAPTGDPGGPDGEVMLDIEVAGAVAPKARIVVYFAPNTDDGFIDCLRAAVHDTVRRPSVVSISWGAPERASTMQSLTDYDAVCQEAAMLGVTICVAAGDHGTDDTPKPSGRANVDFPASSPRVLACGGTHLEESGGAIASETVWNTRDGWATGGGVSEVFPLPAWQAGAGVPVSANPGGKSGRGVPDVCGDADLATGYLIRVDGSEGPTGGTSAVAPLWAGLIALLNQGLGKPIGFINPLLYKTSVASAGLRDIVDGDNGAFPSSLSYRAKPGWDACTGLGSPNGTQLLKALK